VELEKRKWKEKVFAQGRAKKLKERCIRGVATGGPVRIKRDGKKEKVKESGE